MRDIHGNSIYPQYWVESIVELPYLPSICIIVAYLSIIFSITYPQLVGDFPS